jgi:hypothetical protein
MNRRNGSVEYIGSDYFHQRHSHDNRVSPPLRAWGLKAAHLTAATLVFHGLRAHGPENSITFRSYKVTQSRDLKG